MEIAKPGKVFRRIDRDVDRTVPNILAGEVVVKKTQGVPGQANQAKLRHRSFFE
ncbi:MAG: hypothetical protein QW423_02015 [Candidatus Aenigmatarchaeota archaeon]